MEKMIKDFRHNCDECSIMNEPFMCKEHVKKYHAIREEPKLIKKRSCINSGFRFMGDYS